MRKGPDVSVRRVGAAKASEGATFEVVGVGRTQDAVPGGSVDLHRKGRKL